MIKFFSNTLFALIFNENPHHFHSREPTVPLRPLPFIVCDPEKRIREGSSAPEGGTVRTYGPPSGNRRFPTGNEENRYVEMSKIMIIE